MKQTRKLLAYAAAVASFSCLARSASAQAFVERFESDTNPGWNINRHNETRETFGFDHTSLGIPKAPRSLPGDANKALKLEVNMSQAQVSGITLSPTGQSFDSAVGYVLSFDMWINVNGPFPGGGTGSTEFVTAGIGSSGLTVNVHDGSTTTPAANRTGSGGWFAVDGEGGTTRDFRGYKNANEQFPESGQFRAGTSSTTALQNSNAYYTAKWPGQQAPVQQQASFAQQTGTTAAGTVAFAWRKVDITVTATSARWEIDGLEIGTLRTDIGSSFPTTGNIAIGYMDVFTSVSDNENLSFGLIDNVTVTLVPEPSSLVLLPLAALALRRRRTKTA